MKYYFTFGRELLGTLGTDSKYPKRDGKFALLKFGVY